MSDESGAVDAWYSFMKEHWEKLTTGPGEGVTKKEESDFGVDVFRVVAAEDDDTDYNGNVLGVGVAFPEHDVYVDWRREAFPDALDNAHVSIYGSIDDLTQATGNVVEALEHFDAGVDVKETLAEKAVPDNAVAIDSRSEAPEDAEIIQGDRGGLYYVPGGETDGEEGVEGADSGDDPGGEGGEIEAGEPVTVDELEEGMEVEVFGKPMEVEAVSNEEGPNNDETAVAFYNQADEEQQFFFADLLEGEIAATENTDLPARDGGGDGEGQDLAELADEEGLLDADDLEAGDTVEIHGDEVTLDAVASDESGTVVQFQKGGEDFFLYDDMIDIRAPGVEPAAGGDDDGPLFEEGQEIESPSGEPATVAAYDADTGVVAYETEDGEEMLTTEESLTEDDEEPDGPDAELADRLGVHSVNTDGLDDEQTERLASAFEEFQAEEGLPENAVFQVTTTPTDGDNAAVANTAASYSASDRTMFINPDFFNDEHHQQSFERGTTATESPEGTVNHELTHAQHFSDILGDSDMTLTDMQEADIPEEEAEVVSEEVSWYASTSPVELVAEVKSGRMEGHDYSDEVMEIYESYGGPEVKSA